MAERRKKQEMKNREPRTENENARALSFATDPGWGPRY
jgi:hypothetical protein